MVMRTGIHLQYEGQSNPLRSSIIYENNHSHTKQPKHWGSCASPLLNLNPPLHGQHWPWDKLLGR